MATSLDSSVSRALFRRALRPLVVVLSALLLLASCSGAEGAVDRDATASGESSSDAVTPVSGDELALFDSSVVHAIDVTFDEVEYDEMIDVFSSTGEKDWIEATVTIDGTTFSGAGMRLKGNSSLFGLSASTAGNPEDLPWLIRLDKYIDDQTYQGYGDIVIRSTSTETALNEAVAQELLDLSGLAAQKPMATTFTINGGETELRLAVEHPDDEWDDANFDNDDGALYKADSTGDYSYRGDDPDAYAEVFDQKAGDEDLEPLIEFLDFINNADDASFSSELEANLDVEAFATYLAFQDLVGNADDINGRGNNSYLHYDYESEQFTVVSWDLNLAFDTANVGGGGAGGPGGARPERPAGVGGAGGPGDQAQVLVDRFLADETFAALYATKTQELTQLLYASGDFDEILATWVETLRAGAGDLVDPTIIEAEAAAITDFVASVR